MRPEAIRTAAALLIGVLAMPNVTAWAADQPGSRPLLTIPKAMQLAEQASPELKAALQRERVTEQNITILKSFYYPTFDAEAIDSYGFPGSSRDLGISGLMGSPYRSGPAGGMTGNLTLYDPARGYALQASREDVKAVQEQTRVTRFGVDQEALQIYFDASRFRGQQATFLEVAGYVAEVAKEVEKFVRTGQRSVVDRLLVQDQTTDAQMTAASYQERYQVALRRLAIATDQKPESLACPLPIEMTEQSLGLSDTAAGSPLIAQAAAVALAAHANISVYSSQNLPKLMATASVGDMDEARLVGKKDYSGGFGVTLPLFEGYRISGEIQQAQALAAQRDQDLSAVRYQLDELNARYDETINSSRIKLDYLTKEVEVARRAFRLAKERYFSFQGTLVDVREAIRNLSRVQSEIIDVQTDLLLAVGSKALLNGSVVARSS